ncbi:MAG: glycosyltransferase family 2 protein [Pirellulales bacterium]
MSNKSLTIVLPVYNNESQLEPCVSQMLDLASDLTSRFAIMIVDDGSTDDTSNVAQELAAKYPQVFVHRQRQRSGLGPIVSLVQRRIKSDVVIMHDGVTPIDPVQVRRLWRQSDAKSAPAVAGSKRDRDIRDLNTVRATHNAMALVHGRVMGFHIVEPLAADEMSADPKSPLPTAAPAKGQPIAKPRPSDRSGVGQIPPLPRPNFLSAVAEFTLGE